MCGLAQVELFASLEPAVLSQLEKQARARSYRRGEIIFTPGEASTSLFLIHQGRVKLSRTSPDGREVALHLLDPGEPFGEEALLDEPARTVTAQSLDATQLVEIPAAPLKQALTANVHFANALLQVVHRRRQILASELEDLAFKDVGARLAICLLGLAEHHGTPQGADAIAIGLPLTHQELGYLIGSTRETVSLMLEQFRKSGWVAAKGRTLLLLDRAALKRRATT